MSMLLPPLAAWYSCLYNKTIQYLLYLHGFLLSIVKKVYGVFTLGHLPKRVILFPKPRIYLPGLMC